MDYFDKTYIEHNFHFLWENAIYYLPSKSSNLGIQFIGEMQHCDSQC